MFLLDTNVASELRKARTPRIEPKVSAWAERTPAALMYLSTVTVLELEVGVLQMERRDPTQGAVLRRWFERGLLASFEARILSFDLAAAHRGSALHVPDRRPFHDALIAATALAHGLTVVTRNTRDFAPMGVPVLSPWDLPA